jgi:outer membrane protein TolC
MSRGRLFLAAVLAAAALPARAAEAPLAVSLRDAIAAASGSRLDARLAGERTFRARERVLREAAGLLPLVVGSISETRTFRENLAASGLHFAGFANILGPFDSFDARARLTQTVFDWGNWRRTRSARDEARAAALEEASAREQVAAAAALAYLEAVRAGRAKAAAAADADLAARLLALARDRKSAGAATGVDVVRAEARGADADAALLRARTDEREALLRLKRVAGWPLGRELTLTDGFAAVSSTAPALDESVSRAEADRPEIGAAEARAAAAEAAVGAARGEGAPRVQAFGDYALSGTVPADSQGVGSAGVSASIPLFSSGRLSADVAAAKSRRREALAALEDARAEVELDVRLSLERLSESAAEERASERSLTLAEREMEMARDRFKAGVGASVDLTEAQAELARARSAQVSALARYQSARVNYAAATGRAAEFTL